jgi:pSer/pThr/pTyr-binding forkhead associated (FHA) protein
VQVKLPEQDLKTYDVLEENFTIGRGKSSRIQINSGNISRSHLRIVRIGKEILIEDATQSNWVSYNGKKLNKQEGVKYAEGETCILPGDIKISFSYKEATIVQKVKDEMTKFHGILGRVSNPEVVDEEIEKQEEFTGEIELEVTKKRSLTTTNTKKLKSVSPNYRAKNNNGMKTGMSFIVLLISVLGIMALILKS